MMNFLFFTFEMRPNEKLLRHTSLVLANHAEQHMQCITKQLAKLTKIHIK